jgi:tRNA A37 threonylcarbamoyltransferase TsaD
MAQRAQEKGIKTVFVSRRLSSDNAAMIALCAFKKMRYSKELKNDIAIRPNMVLRSWADK